MQVNESDRKYLDILLEPIKLCSGYTPKFGTAKKDGSSLLEFKNLYASDPLYHWIGFDSDLMYAAHKAAGGITSIYRQLGIGCERLVRQIISDQLDLNHQQVIWGYEIKKNDGSTAKLTLDAKISIDDIKNIIDRNKVQEWLKLASIRLGLDENRSKNLVGTVFEIRQGYKSADSKRQNADLMNAIRAYNENLLPVMMVLSCQINTIVLKRYQSAQLLVLVGILNDDPTISTYAFCEKILNYSLEEFFRNNSSLIREEMDKILTSLLNP
ncbi:hypothetical protein H6G33_11925 [Calothrix sp. FACHB-1219]|uniref:hypothetical protein n=1 Tax=unclassified Calothrix TaxID=2619626 RepID=UPI001685CF87|nr:MULTISPECIES: hypothetical protein [unclassified Calothrix]MBD2202333.1 hypothetical protein [Calothrix sp. FACHB-168]MBD2217739.1 hypothetical protein [Calothrix sp. FACHB-1219]